MQMGYHLIASLHAKLSLFGSVPTSVLGAYLLHVLCWMARTWCKHGLSQVCCRAKGSFHICLRPWARKPDVIPGPNVQYRGGATGRVPFPRCLKGG